MKPESVIQREVVNEIMRQGWGVIRINSLHARTRDGGVVTSYVTYPGNLTSGVADLIAVKDGRIEAIETKGQSGRLRDTQHKFRKWCDHFGLPFRVARSTADAVMRDTIVIKSAEISIERRGDHVLIGTEAVHIDAIDGIIAALRELRN